jgi:DNA-binding GntR family transcriptional regulator
MVGQRNGSGGTPSQTDAAVERIRSLIIDLELAPGSRIDEPLLLSEYGFGRTPAREAINRLAAEGFVNIAPNRGGTFVRKLDLEEIREIVTAQQLAETIVGNLCRLDDEGLVADLVAIQRRYKEKVHQRRYLDITELNQQFHLRMHQTISNSFAYEFARSTHRHVRRLNVLLYQLEASDHELHEARFEENLREHEAIIDAVRTCDRDTLRTLCPAHARKTHDRLVQILKRGTVDPFNMDIHVDDLLSLGSSSPSGR